MRKVKILFFAADPIRGRPDGVPLELADEMREIQQNVKKARYGHRLHFEPHGAARADDLMDFLEDTDARVVHFSGHGGGRGLVLVAPDGYSVHPVNADALRRVFRQYHGPVRLVVLSACSSKAEAQAVADIVGCAIGTSSTISDTAAIKFNSRFYRAIANGYSVRRAFEHAETVLQVYGVPKAEYPELFARQGVDPDDLVLVKTYRPVPRRVAAAGIACVLTAAIAAWRPAVPPGLTASDLACGAQSTPDGIRPLAGLPVASSAANLVNAKALYQARNYDEAASAFEQAAAAGNAEAMGCLGYMYLYGRGVDPDSTAGFQLVHRAATQERDPHAMYALAMAYLNGVGTTARKHLAKDWFEKAADKGYPEAMRSLGSLLLEEKNDSSYLRALEWFRKAVDAGSPDAHVDVGMMYELGLAVPRNPAEAFRWYRNAARAGSPQGMLAVGRSYENGVGVPQDYRQARVWYLRAARKGSADAMNSIGVLYQHGLGVRRSRGKAIRWYKRGAEAGSSLAEGTLEALGRD